MANCNLNLPCSQTAPSDPVTHKYVLEINTAVGDIGGAIVGNCETGVAISGNALNATGTAIGIGVSATTQSGNAGEFQSVRAIGVVGSAGLPDGGNPDFQGIGVQGNSTGGTAVQGNSTGGTAVQGNSTGGTAVQGNSTGGTAGLFTNSIAEDLTANNNPALDVGTTGTGVAASVHIDNVSSSAFALEATTAGTASAAYFSNPKGGDEATIWVVPPQPGGNAAFLFGNVDVLGTLNAEAKNFVIDHPLDPANKYLTYASIESSEQACVYSGNIVLDDKGEAVVNLPVWVEALNEDFRYQLTCVGRSAPVYIADEVANNQFCIGGGTDLACLVVGSEVPSELNVFETVDCIVEEGSKRSESRQRCRTLRP
jgi:hypothetical protein